MLYTRILVLLTCALSFAACSTSQHAAAPPAAKPSSSADAGATSAALEGQAAADDRVICRVVTPTGSRLADRVCMTVSQWAAHQSAGRDALNKAQEDGRLKDIPPGG